MTKQCLRQISGFCNEGILGTIESNRNEKWSVKNQNFRYVIFQHGAVGVGGDTPSGTGQTDGRMDILVCYILP